MGAGPKKRLMGTVQLYAYTLETLWEPQQLRELDHGDIHVSVHGWKIVHIYQINEALGVTASQPCTSAIFAV